MITFRHAGDRGDIIASLPVVKWLCHHHNEKAAFFIEAAPYTREMLTPDKWLGIDRVIGCQEYVGGVGELRNIRASINLNDFRVRLMRSMRMNINKDKCLTDWMAEQHGAPISCKDEMWLSIPPRKEARVVFNRTGAGRAHYHVYQNNRFPWRKVWDAYHNDSVFVGTEDEHKIFCATIGDVRHAKTSDLYEAAQVISGCDLFVGNQSCCFWFAEGMKKRVLLEIWPAGPNCLIPREGSTPGWDENVVLPDL